MFNVFANVSREKERIFFLLRLTMNVMCYGATPCRMAMGKIGMFGSALLYFGLDCNWELLAVGCVIQKTFNESKHNRCYRWPYADQNCDMPCIFGTTGVIG